MVNPTEIVTPGGTRLVIPLAWTCWTFKGRQYQRASLDAGRICIRINGHRHYWTGQRWEPEPASARFLEVV